MYNNRLNAGVITMYCYYCLFFSKKTNNKFSVKELIRRTLLFSDAHKNRPFSAPAPPPQKKTLQIKTIFLTMYEVIHFYYQSWRQCKRGAKISIHYDRLVSFCFTFW